MNVKTLINPTVQAIRVVDLQKGTVYKRITKNYSDTYKVTYGVVLDILNGEETFIDVVEVEKSYGDPKFNFTVLGEESDLNMYPTTKEELVEHFAGVEDSIINSIEKAKEEVIKKEAGLQMFRDISNNRFAKVQDTAFEPITLNANLTEGTE